ncbi:MAG: NUDIX domain-containing protein [Beijerinckiaceae bacterium]|nr:NUDIX domain-containing protein [Beijerinckiaceae bacterium]
MRFETSIRRAMHVWFRFARPMTLGVRGLVLDPQGRILLVRQTYTSGWLLPGGGVEAGETLVEALRREVLEEGNVEIAGEPELHGMFFNRRASRRDHVALFVARDARVLGLRPPDREIAEAGFFHLDELPHDTTAATRARIAEVFEGAVRDAYW